MLIPEYIDCARKVDNEEELTPLERFIYAQEPAGDHDIEFREQLQAVVDSLH